MTVHEVWLPTSRQAIGCAHPLQQQCIPGRPPQGVDRPQDGLHAFQLHHAGGATEAKQPAARCHCLQHKRGGLSGSTLQAKQPTAG